MYASSGLVSEPWFDFLDGQQALLVLVDFPSVKKGRSAAQVGFPGCFNLAAHAPLQPLKEESTIVKIFMPRQSSSLGHSSVQSII
jgi:N-acetyl-gamma-glutamylphosphate reductase